MAMYKVYLKYGFGVFNAEATRIEEKECYYNLSTDYEHVAVFDKDSVLAIINTDKAEREFASGDGVGKDNFTIPLPYIVNMTTKKGEEEC